ncbi:GNAT family N-acetyltransferase [Chitinophaga sp.]|uniref:GNAT family N-acetyltransferase n=1 Tax=Chitinophaga sp. TaxID=1869181 RepID=UPI002F955E63
MKTFEATVLTPAGMDSLLQLQRSNLVQHISSQTAKTQGFLTFEYSRDILERMMRDMAQPVITAGETLIGYALATSAAAAAEIELMRPLAEMAEILTLNGSRVSQLRHYFMGQICVREGWRGQGLFDALYAAHKTLFSATYDCIITEIAADNLRSQAAHARVGFQKIHTHMDGGKEWDVVAWDWRS